MFSLNITYTQNRSPCPAPCPQLHIIKSFRKRVNLCARFVWGSAGGHRPLPHGQCTPRPMHRAGSLCKALGSDQRKQGDFLGEGDGLRWEMRAKGGQSREPRGCSIPSPKGFSPSLAAGAIGAATGDRGGRCLGRTNSNLVS